MPSMGRSIQLTEIGGLRRGSGKAKARTAADVLVAQDEAPASGAESAGTGDLPAAAVAEGAEQDLQGVTGGAADQDTQVIAAEDSNEQERTDAPEADALANPAVDPAQPSQPGSDTSVAQETGANDASRHGTGSASAPTYQEGPVEPQYPPVQVPEPGPLGLLLVGLLACVMRRRSIPGVGAAGS